MKQYRRKVKYSEIAEIQLSYKPGIKLSEAKQINSSHDAYEVLSSCWQSDKLEFVEHCNVLLLNRAHKKLGWLNVSMGGVTGTIIDPKIVFAAAIKSNATSFIISHNHPSGNLVPSESDKKITAKMKQGALLFDLKLLDHLILTAEGYFSFADHGLL